MLDSILRKDVFQAWSVVALGFITLALSYSARALLPMAMPVWEGSFGWQRLTLSLVVALAMMVMAVIAPFMGSVVDRYGARSLLGSGLAALAAGMFIIASLHSAEQSWLRAGF